jgi:hypothetical protein
VLFDSSPAIGRCQPAPPVDHSLAGHIGPPGRVVQHSSHRPRCEGRTYHSSHLPVSNHSAGRHCTYERPYPFAKLIARPDPWLRHGTGLSLHRNAGPPTPEGQGRAGGRGCGGYTGYMHTCTCTCICTCTCPHSTRPMALPGHMHNIT